MYGATLLHHCMNHQKFSLDWFNHLIQKPTIDVNKLDKFGANLPFHAVNLNDGCKIMKKLGDKVCKM